MTVFSRDSLEPGTFMAIGQTPGVKIVFNSAYVPTVDFTTKRTMWGSDDYDFIADYPWPTTDRQLQVSSDNVLDVGTVLLIRGLDINRKEIQELVITNGQTPISTLQLFYRINEFLVVSNTPTGIIYLTSAGTSLTNGVPASSSPDCFAVIDQDPTEPTGIYKSNNVARVGVLAIPADKYATVQSALILPGFNERFSCNARILLPGTDVWQNQFPLEVEQAKEVIAVDDPLYIPPGADLEYRISRIGGNTATNCAIRTTFRWYNTNATTQ